MSATERESKDHVPAQQSERARAKGAHLRRSGEELDRNERSESHASEKQAPQSVRVDLTTIENREPRTGEGTGNDGRRDNAVQRQAIEKSPVVHTRREREERPDDRRPGVAAVCTVTRLKLSRGPKKKRWPLYGRSVLKSRRKRQTREEEEESAEGTQNPDTASVRDESGRNGNKACQTVFESLRDRELVRGERRKKRGTFQACRWVCFPSLGSPTEG